MKHKLLWMSVVIVTLLFFANSFYKLEYNMSLVDFFVEESWLTPTELNYLKQHGDLIYGSDQNSPPLRYVNSDTGQYEGLVIDYIAALSMELGVNIQTKPMIWNEALSAIDAGATDLCDMYASPERAKRFLFSEPIYYQRGAILVRRDSSEITRREELEGKKVAAVQGDYVFEYLQNTYKNVDALPTQDLRSAIKALENKQVEAVLGDESVINYFLSHENLSKHYVLLDSYLYEREAYLGVQKENTVLLNILNKAIYRLNKKNTMERIYEKWFAGQPLITKNRSSEKSLLLLGFICFVGALTAFGLYYWNWLLKREVQRQTEALKASHEALEKTFAEYKVAERRVLQARKMAAIGQLSAGIAHEIRTPLGIIRNAAFLMRRDPSERHIVQIEQSVDRANRIIDNLLNFSRISDDRISCVSLAGFMEDLWKLNAKAWDSQAITFTLEGDQTIEAEVYLESLKHVMLNFFSNAVDAMPEGGLLTVTLLENAAEQLVLIKVSDTGMGMSEATIAQLFDPFFTTKDTGKGTGLGLYIAYNEIQKMGAQIAVESTLGAGSSFTVILPKMAPVLT